MRRTVAILLLATPLIGAIDPASAPTPASAVPICHTEAKPDDDALRPAKAILAGYGSGGFKIATRSPEAQAYFDNGMQLAHAFAHRAATAAFMRAEELDPTCAMCVWGEAWSRGPTINFDIDDKQAKAAAALADKAAVLAEGGPPKERALIAALQLRYRKGGGAGAGDDAFARAMDALARAYPDDNEIAVMTADAFMIPASLRVYVRHGAPADQHASLMRARELLLGVLQRDPNDTGAIHFYIHATENDGVGTLALPYAMKLEALAPAASHLVHMPSHTFLWAGRFKMAEASNIDAVKIDQANAARLKTKGGAFGLSYHVHNVQFGLGAAMLDNDADGALFLARDEAARMGELKGDDVYQQGVLATAYAAMGRYADLKTVQALPDPGGRLPFDRAMRWYAVGEAAARASDIQAVKAAVAAIGPAPSAALLKAKGVEDRYALVLVQHMTDVARLVLTGRAAALEGRYAEAETAYRAAAEIEEQTLATHRDPPLWWYPPRRSLAAVLLAEGKRADAAREIKTVLLRWPYDPVSLRIAAEAGAESNAAETLAYASRNWTGDIKALPVALM
jgi:tetratricopeptide (TPR) repeat protein